MAASSQSYTLAGLLLAALGWAGLTALIMYVDPRNGPLPVWAFFVLGLLAATGTAMPFVRLLNKRFSRDLPGPDVILRQSIWVGFFAVTCAWLLRNGLLNPATVLLLLLAVAGVEWFLRLRERARWTPLDDED